MNGQDFSLIDVIAAALAAIAVAEIVVAQFLARQQPMNLLVVSLLFWEGIAMFACAGVIYIRQDFFQIATIVSVVAIWMAGATVGLLRAGVFDPPPK